MRSLHTCSEVAEAILKTLRYFHMFRHPLYADEIRSFLSVKTDNYVFVNTLDGMLLEGAVYRYQDMYMLEDNPAFAEKRIAGSIMAEKLMVVAEKSATTISKFPFVKAVCISGSLSKGYADERSDIDLFIITQENRLWTCRMFLHLYKKFTFLLGRQHSFCMNYFLDESHLLLEENNVFTATELSTLIPVYGADHYKSFIDSNSRWLATQFPNKTSFYRQLNTSHGKSSMIKRASELLLNLLVPGLMNRSFMKITDTWWRYKWRKRNYPMQDYDLAMKTKLHVSKNHPANYQKKVLHNVSSKPLMSPVLQAG